MQQHLAMFWRTHQHPTLPTESTETRDTQQSQFPDEAHPIAFVAYYQLTAATLATTPTAHQWPKHQARNLCIGLPTVPASKLPGESHSTDYIHITTLHTSYLFLFFFFSSQSS